MNDMTLLIQVAILTLAIAAAGGFGFLVAQSRYRKELGYQAEILASEMNRLRRRASTAKDTARKYEQEADRQRLKSRRR